MARRITLDFLRTESASGLVIAGAALAAIILANSPGAGVYYRFIRDDFTIQLGPFLETRSVLAWIRDGLMAVAFFVVGLEIKHEVTKGELANPRRLALPIAAALGGIAATALVYLALNRGGAAPLGWPTAAPTDMAFALAALGLAGPRLPPTLRTFLLTLAIASDLASVAVVGIAFTATVRIALLVGALAALALMGLLSRWRQAPYLFYALGFLLVWGFTLKSGVSTSVAGVAAAFTIPSGARKPGRPGVLEDFMESLHPYVAFLILPLFAFSAAGFSFDDLALRALFGPVALGVAAGMLIAKPVGAFAISVLLMALKVARRPTGARWIELAGVCLLSGVGFTLSLYIAELAFPQAQVLQAEARVGVVAGSILSALAGMALLGWSQARRTLEAAA
jgi:NhaA family Na+:H+ antiporter